MIEKVNLFPIERLYFLESEDFLVDREKIYLKKNKTIKLNSFWIGVSKLKVNNDKLLFLFNGLRGYYDVRSRYIKQPYIFEKRVPMAKRIYVNDYLIKKYKYSDMLIYSLNQLNRPTITLKKEIAMNYLFPSRLVEYLNQKRELLNSVEANKEFYKNVKELKNIDFRFSLKARRKRKKGYRRIEFLDSISLGMTENLLIKYISYMSYIIRQRDKAIKLVCNQKNLIYARRKRKLKRFKRFYNTTIVLKLLFLVSKKYLQKKYYTVRKRKNKKSKNKLIKIKDGQKKKLSNISNKQQKDKDYRSKSFVNRKKFVKNEIF